MPVKTLIFLLSLICVIQTASAQTEKLINKAAADNFEKSYNADDFNGVFNLFADVMQKALPIDQTKEATYEDWSITSHEGRTKAFWQWDHVRLYGLDFSKKLRDVDFIVTEDDHIKDKGEALIQKEGLEATTNYICTKR